MVNRKLGNNANVSMDEEMDEFVAHKIGCNEIQNEKWEPVV